MVVEIQHLQKPEVPSPTGFPKLVHRQRVKDNIGAVAIKLILEGRNFFWAEKRPPRPVHLVRKVDNQDAAQSSQNDCHESVDNKNPGGVVSAWREVSTTAQGQDYHRQAR